VLVCIEALPKKPLQESIRYSALLQVPPSRLMLGPFTTRADEHGWIAILQHSKRSITMPCYTIQKSKVEFLTKTTDTNLLAAGLRHLGFKVTETPEGLYFEKAGCSGSYASASGLLQVGESWGTSELKRAYFEQVVESQARTFGWRLQWSTNRAGNREATVIRRR
jgi:hypothetical protein